MKTETLFASRGILGCYSGAAEESGLPGCDAVSVGVTDVSKNVAPSFTTAKWPLSSRSQADMQLSTSYSIKCGKY